MAGHGGFRQGAGRKARPKIETPDDGSEFFDQKCREALPDVFPALKALALGVKLAAYTKAKPQDHPEAEEMTDARGTRVWVYTTPPDKAAAIYIMDRALGKAPTKEKTAQDTAVILQCDVPAPGGDAGPGASEEEDDGDADAAG